MNIINFRPSQTEYCKTSDQARKNIIKLKTKLDRTLSNFKTSQTEYCQTPDQARQHIVTLHTQLDRTLSNCRPNFTEHCETADHTLQNIAKLQSKINRTMSNCRPSKYNRITFRESSSYKLQHCTNFCIGKPIGGDTAGEQMAKRDKWVTLRGRQIVIDTSG